MKGLNPEGKVSESSYGTHSTDLNPRLEQMISPAHIFSPK
jgi:hypothetical protein